MANEDGSVWVVFNGEIYNHRELQRELEARGHVFRGRSDTEVLPHLYEEEGEALFRRLRGMFAVAILDLRRHRLLLGRDRFGIKPLFYAPTGRAVAFASELNALRLFPDLDLSPDRQAISDYASVLYVPAPQTVFRGLRVLEPGTFADASIGADGDVDLRVVRYHSWPSAVARDLTLGDAVDRADSLVEDAVARQLESDVQLGALLSGGIDSSLVSAAAQRRSDETLRTFNVRPADATYDETPAARAVAEHVGSLHTTLDMDPSGGSWDDVTRLLRHAGQPFADTSLFAVDAVSEAMRRFVTVALSGDGGDEGFGGYDLYRRLEPIERLRRLPAPFWHGASAALGPAARAGLVRPTLAQRVRDLTGADDTTVVQTLFSWIREREHARLVLGSEGLEPARRLFERRWDAVAGTRLERISRHAVEVNLRLVLPDDFLFKVDTGSMRHGLEVRVPLLDEDVVEFGLALPHTLRADRRMTKLVLRGVAERRLPPGLSALPKRGFAVPVDRWVGPDFRARLREELLASSSPVSDQLDRGMYEPWVRAFCDGGQVPGLTRDGLYQRVVMLLALDLALRPAPALVAG